MTGNNICRSWGEYVLPATAVVSEVVQTWLTEMNFPGGRVAIIPAPKEFGSGFWRLHACNLEFYTFLFGCGAEGGLEAQKRFVTIFVR